MLMSRLAGYASSRRLINRQRAALLEPTLASVPDKTPSHMGLAAMRTTCTDHIGGDVAGPQRTAGRAENESGVTVGRGSAWTG